MREMENKKRNSEAVAEQIIAITEDGKRVNVQAFNTPVGQQNLLEKFSVSGPLEEHKNRVEELTR